MDTFKIIKELTAKDDMLSGQSIKDNFKELLPVEAVHRGWGIGWGIGQPVFDFKPDEDYPHKEPYEKPVDTNKDDERIAVINQINEDTDKYNEWVDEQNVIHKKELIEKVPDGGNKAYSSEELNIKTKKYSHLPQLKAWLNGFQFSAPQFRPIQHAIHFGFVDDKDLYKLKHEMKERIFIKRFNAQLFSYIQESIKWADKNKTWDQDHILFQPNIEFGQWFQVRNIKPEKVPTFETAIIDLTYDEQCEEAFGTESLDLAFYKIEQKMRKVIQNNEHLFQVNGKLQLTKGYEADCRYWTQRGSPLTVKKMQTEATRYPK